MSLPQVSSGTRLHRIRQISRTESETSCEEAARLTNDTAEGDDDAGSCEYHDLPPPPDGGYGWVICFASFLCNLIVDGIAYTFGVFLGEFVNYFGEGKGKVAWVGSLLSGVYLAVGPLVSALCNKFGCRAVCVAGSILASAAFVLSTFSSSISMLMLTYGVMGGLGFGMIYLPAVVAVGYYFETKRSLATGIAVCGSGVGTFSFAPLAIYLLEQFGWKGANLILAGLILNCAVFGALMRPLVYPKLSSVKPLLQRMAEEKRFQMERGSIGGSYFMVQLPDGTMEKRMKVGSDVDLVNGHYPMIDLNDTELEAPLNIDPGVHSSFHLDQFGGGGLPSVPTLPTLTNVPTVPTLPTITESKVADQSESSSNDSNEEPKAKDIKRKAENGPAPNEFSKDVRNMPRNVSSPAFSTQHQGLPKNGSVPFFDRQRKPSTGERFKPSLAAIRSASKTSISSNGEARRLGRTASKNNNAEYGDGDGDSIIYSSKLSLSQQQHREPTRMVRPMSRKDIFYSGSVTNLPEYQSQKSLQGYRNSVLSLPQAGISPYNRQMTDVEKQEQYDLCPCFVMPASFKAALSTMMDVSLLKDPAFMMIGISNFFGMAGLYIPFVYLLDAAQLNGIDPGSASLLVSIIGITNTIGRVLCGWLADFPWIDALLFNNICLIIATIATGMTPLCSSYASYIAVAIAFGIAISGYISLTSIILVDLLGLEKLTNAFGLLILFRGSAAIIGSPLAGAIYDATLSYDIPFFTAGAFFAISTITSFMAPMMKRCTKPAETAQHLEALTPIDEDVEEEEEEEDPEDRPITMGKKPDRVPTITHTAPSPLSHDPPSKPGDHEEVSQKESVL